MQQNTPQQNLSPSLMEQDLPEYERRMYLSSFQQGGSSSSFSFNNMEKMMNPFDGTIIETEYRKLEDLKVAIFNQRNKLIKDLHLQNTNRQAINTLPNYQESEQKIKQQKISAKQSQEYNDQLKYQLRDIEIQQKKNVQEKKIYEEVVEFQSKLKEKFNQQRQSLLREDIKNEGLVQTLLESFKKRSEQIVNKLKPYLIYSLKNLQQDNQIYTKNNHFLSKIKSNYDQQVVLSKQNLTKQQEISKRYELEDQIEDQMAFKQQIKQYNQQFKQDAQIQKNKLITQQC